MTRSPVPPADTLAPIVVGTESWLSAEAHLERTGSRSTTG
jgi:hypothetical protein